jgi:dTDP-4-amino-4,6-dideoxygalactose transaminase
MFNDIRMRNAAMLSDRINVIEGVETPYVSKHVKHVFNQYTIRVLDGRDELKDFLEKKGISTGIYYPIPIHKQPLYRKFAVKLEEAEKASREVLSLPVHPGVGEREIEYILSCLEEWE